MRADIPAGEDLPEGKERAKARELSFACAALHTMIVPRTDLSSTIKAKARAKVEEKEKEKAKREANHGRILL